MLEPTSTESTQTVTPHDSEKHKEGKVTFKKCAPKHRRQIKRKTQSDEEDEDTASQRSSDAPHIAPAAKKPCIGPNPLVQTVFRHSLPFSPFLPVYFIFFINTRLQSTTTSIEDNKGSKLFSYQSSGAAVFHF